MFYDCLEMTIISQFFAASLYMPYKMSLNFFNTQKICPTCLETF